MIVTPTIAQPATAETTHASACSPLLELPGELRNRIWQYALTTENGLDMVWVSHRRSPQLFARGRDAAEDEGRVEFNQLKYTCHALHKETAGWEAKFNRVVVCTHAADPRPVELFGNFLATCAPAKAAWFTDLDLVFETQAQNRGEDSARIMISLTLETSPALLSVAAFCKHHPHVNVRYFLWGFNVNVHAAQFMSTGSLLAKVFRSIDVTSQILQEHVLAKRSPDSPRIRSPAIVAAAALPNLSFWPHGKCLDEGEIRQQLKKHEFIVKVDVCVEFTKEWYTSGI
jgi:hypothetical protein